MLLVILTLMLCSLLLNGCIIWMLYRDRDKRLVDQGVTFNQLCSANQRLGAIISMLGYRLDDVERFAHESVNPTQHFMAGRDKGADAPIVAAFVPNPDVVPPLERAKEKPE